MEPCYVYLGRKKRDCIAFQDNSGKPCWQLEGTLCNHRGIQIQQERNPGKKEKACALSGCIYYQEAKQRARFS